jgi:hypothetical protein
VEKGELPEDGTAMIGYVPLPPGRRVYTMEEEKLVAWVTDEPWDDAGRAWMALSDAHADSGLVPVLLRAAPHGPGGEPRVVTEPTGEDFGFVWQADVSLLSGMTARDVLARQWDTSETLWDEHLAARAAPFGRQFPGLAPAGDARLPAEALHQAVLPKQPVHLGLVAASRPADVPPVVGWGFFGVDEHGPEARSLEVAAVLRSWEVRYGARLLQIGGDVVLRVLVERPPRTIADAQALAVEHLAFGDECGEMNWGTVGKLAEHLVNAPLWRFWWD